MLPSFDEIYGSGEDPEFQAAMAEQCADRLELADLVAQELDDIEARMLFGVGDEDDARCQIVLRQWQWNLAMELWWL